MEACEQFGGFLIMNGLSGGTGTGCMSLAVERLSVDYGKINKTAFCVHPSALSNKGFSVVEPYNFMLSTHGLLEHIDGVVVLDNESLFKRCYDNLKIESP